MKGLLRGLRYISQMFEDEKEPEMQIGLPTDVKHVAHIGMDGPSANKPSWMNEYSAAPELANPENSNPKQIPSAAGNHDSLPPLGNGNGSGNEKPKKSRRKPSIGSGSPVSSPKGSEKQSRRPRSSNLSMGSPGQEGRRNRNSSRGSESPSHSQELSEVPKKSRRKKSKESKEGSTSSSRSRTKRPSSLSDSDAMELESCGGDFDP